MLPMTRTIAATCLALSVAAVSAATVPDVAGKVIDLGIPAYGDNQPNAPFPRNPWDMRLFNGRIYFAGGNSDNNGSPGNCAPVRILSLVPGQATITAEGLGTATGFPEEQFDVFHVIDGALYTTGHDPRLSWIDRTIYRRATNGSWTQHVSKGKDGSWGVHCYDIIGFKGKLFSCGYNYAVSGDAGVTWTKVTGDAFRMYALFTVGGRLYASGGYSPGPMMAEYDETKQAFVTRNDLRAQSGLMLPGFSLPDPVKGTKKIVRPIALGTSAMYLGGRASSDHQTTTSDVYLARSLTAGAVDVVRLTPAGERPWDVMERGGVAYLLTSRKTGGTGTGERFTATVWRSAAPYAAWTPVFTCSDLPTFARSFEESGGDWYLGLGTDDGQAADASYPDASYTDGVKADSGRILRVPASAYGGAVAPAEVAASCNTFWQGDLRSAMAITLEQSTTGIVSQRQVQIRNVGGVGSTLRITGITVLTDETVNATGSVDLRGQTLPIAVARPTTAHGVVTFPITCTPRALGAWSVPILVTTDDADEASFRVVLSGTAEAAVRPEVRAVYGGRVLATASQTIAVASTAAGQGKAVNISVFNEGTAPLTITSLDFVTTQMANCTGTRATAMPATVAPGATLWAALSVKPAAAGAWNAGLRLVTSDADEKTLVWRLEGVAVATQHTAAPEMPQGISAVDLEAVPLIDLDPPALYAPGPVDGSQGRSEGGKARRMDGEVGSCGMGSIAGIIAAAFGLLSLRRRGRHC